MGVFEYSERGQRRKLPLDGKVDAETINDRRNRLMVLQKKISREISAS